MATMKEVEMWASMVQEARYHQGITLNDEGDIFETLRSWEQACGSEGGWLLLDRWRRGRSSNEEEWTHMGEVVGYMLGSVADEDPVLVDELRRCLADEEERGCAIVALGPIAATEGFRARCEDGEHAIAFLRDRPSASWLYRFWCALIVDKVDDEACRSALSKEFLRLYPDDESLHERLEKHVKERS